MPNPTNDWFTIRYDEMPKEILVYNSLGRLLQNVIPAPEQVQIDIRDYATGICFVKIQNTLHKIVKN
jgi:Secretion system C-terminal sorting domain